MLMQVLQQLHPPVTPGRSGDATYTAAPFQVGCTAALYFRWCCVVLVLYSSTALYKITSCWSARRMMI
jgi:hypothetical protein